MAEHEDIALSVEGVSKTFKLPHERHSGLKQSLISKIGGRHQRGYELQHVLKDISFDVNKGEFFGIVGRNGSGKSTLLKLISGIYTPDSGKVKINGSLTPFIELGVGFNHELSGRENVYMNGALMGFSRQEMDAKYEDIVEFAELENFMDQKLKNYSSGMQVRLAFAIAIQADSDILILDEVLAVGDEAFQRKCFKYFADIKQQQKTVILVTHSMDSVQRFCTRAMLISDGEILEIGNTATVAQKYTELNNPAAAEAQEKKKEKDRRTSKYLSATVNCKRDKDSGKVDFVIKLKQKTVMADPVVALLLTDENGRQVYRWTTDTRLERAIDLKTDNKINLSIQDIFPVGVFNVSLRVLKRDRSEDYATLFNIAQFEVINDSSDRWDIDWHPNETYSIENEE